MLANFFALAWTQLAGRVIRFIYLVAIARYLSQSDVGVFSYGTALYISLAAIGVCGQEQLLSMRVGRKHGIFATIAPHSLVIVASSLIVVTGLGLTGLWVSEADATHLAPLLVLMLTVPARGAVVWIRACFVAIERTTWIPRYEATFRGVEVFFGMIALAAGAGLVVVCLIHVVIWLVEAALAWRLLVRATGFSADVRIRAAVLKMYWRASAVLMVGPWLLFIFPQLAVIGLRQIQQDMTLLAHLGIALQFFTTLLVVPISLVQAIVPGVVRAARGRDESDLMVLLTALKLSLLLGTLLAAVTLVAGPAILVALFGEQYAPAGDVFVLLMWGLGPFSAAYIAIVVLNSVGAWRSAGTAAGLMVGVMTVAMAWIGTSDGMDVLHATVTALLIASVTGMVWAFLSLSRVLALRNGVWWFRATCLFIACMALALSGVLSPLWASVVGVMLAVGGSLSFGVLSPAELSGAWSRGGRRQAVSDTRK